MSELPACLTEPLTRLRAAEIEIEQLVLQCARLQAALSTIIDNVETGSYESTGLAIREAKKLLR
jgi:hypothetical protein